MRLFKNITIPITSAYSTPALADSSGPGLMAEGLAQGHACARHFTEAISPTVNPVLSHSHLSWFYYLMFLSFFFFHRKMGLTIHLIPHHQICDLPSFSATAFQGYLFLHELLPIEVMLISATQIWTVFASTSLVFFCWLHIPWHISNLKMASYSELHTYFKCVCLCQMEMFIFRRLLIETGEQHLSIFSFLKARWILH